MSILLKARASTALFSLVIAWFSLAMLRCSSSPGPSATNDQANITLQANPAQIPSKTGISTITAIGTKATGAPIWDGVEVYFSSDIGTLDPAKATFQDGRAVTYLRAPSKTGTANISATSGTVAITGIQIQIGATAGSLLLSASRTTLPVGGGSVTLRAMVLDDNENPMAGTPVIFTTTAGVLKSQGHEIKTDSDGIAKDVLTTDEDATVTARSGSVSDTVDITVKTDPENEPPVPLFSYSPQDPQVKTTIYFNGGLSSDPDGWIVKYEWDFGDGKTALGERPSHSYSEPGTYNVVLCVTDNDHARACSLGTSIVVSSTTNTPPTADFSFSPTEPIVSSTVYFDGTLSLDSDGRIVKYEWNFGDGSDAGGERPSHSYASAGTYNVVLCVTDDGGLRACVTKPVTLAAKASAQSRKR